MYANDSSGLRRVSCYKKMRGKGNLFKDIDYSSNSKLGVESCPWDCLGIAFLFSIIGCGKYVYASPRPSQSDDLVTHAFPHLWSFTCRVTFVSSHRFFFCFFVLINFVLSTLICFHGNTLNESLYHCQHCR